MFCNRNLQEYFLCISFFHIAVWMKGLPTLAGVEEEGGLQHLQVPPKTLVHRAMPVGVVEEISVIIMAVSIQL
jgi:hypothetical protein